MVISDAKPATLKYLVKCMNFTNCETKGDKLSIVSVNVFIIPFLSSLFDVFCNCCLSSIVMPLFFTARRAWHLSVVYDEARCMLVYCISQYF